MKIIAGMALLALVGCQAGIPGKSTGSDTPKPTSFSTEETKAMLTRERAVMEGIFKQLQLKPRRTGTGLMYAFIDSSATPRIQDGQLVEMNRHIFLSDGSPVDRDHGVFRVGQDGRLELGLHEGLPLTGPGDSVVFVLPSHLAYGMTGDGPRVPAGSALVIYLHILNVQP
jgi:FKBP-type peptidyl-prolyl cis-trans isomerase